MADVDSTLPQYRSHKTVRAARIVAIPLADDGRTLMVDRGDGTTVEVVPEHAYFAKHQPQVGGYYVVYADGYRSFSPAEAFEAGYSLLPIYGVTPISDRPHTTEPLVHVLFPGAAGPFYQVKD